MSIVTAFNQWITLADAHELLGTNSPADDISVQSMIDSIDQMIASYLGRELKHCEHLETTFRPEGSYLELDQFPVISFTTITSDGSAAAESDFAIDFALGLMYWLETSLVFTATQPTNVVIQYIAGYTTLPAELVVVFNTLLTTRYEAGGSSATADAGDIKKVSMVGVGSVEYAPAGGVQYSGVDRTTGVPEELKPYVGLLDVYRSNKRMGVV